MTSILLKARFDKLYLIKTIAQLIIDVRKQAGLTQEELAFMAKTSQSAIARLESGKSSRLVSLLLLAKLAKICGLRLRLDFLRAQIPSDFKTYFWDTDLANIDIQEHRPFIIERLLELGNVTAHEWLSQTYDRLTIIWVIKTSANLSKKSANFWALYYNIGREDIKCLKKLSPIMHKNC